MQSLVDNVLGIAKESIKTFSHESFNNTVRLINSFFGFILAMLPAKSSLAGIQGWELYPTLRGPRLPSWMEEGVSTFNAFIHEHESDEDFGSDSDDGSSVYGDAGSSLNSPSFSQASPNARPSSSKHGRRKQNSILKRTLRKLLFPLKILCSGKLQTRPTPRFRSSTRSLTPKDSSEGEVQITQDLPSDSSSASLNNVYNIEARSHLISGTKDYVVPKHTGDYRRGIIEDLQILVELSIERIFDGVRRFIQICFSPLAILNFIFNRFKSNRSVDDDEYVVVGTTSTLGDSDPTPHKQVRRGQTLNTDGRTCEDIISSLGYPYESLRVTTGDGHILLLERIPRPESRKVLYLQHGLLDSSLGWVSNGVVGSQAFAAYDQGYDVFLGNFRGLVSKEHVNQHISSRRYWQFSVNEHGTQDIPAMLSKVHEIKMNDLKQPKDTKNMSDVSSSTRRTGEEEEEEEEEHKLPYAMCGVAHSLGGASILMYVVTRQLEKKPHYLSRLVLLSPAGFHEDGPAVCKILRYVIPILAPVMGPLVPGLYIPTQTCRALFNKLARDFQTYPALGGLVQIAISSLVGGDSSNWIGAIGMSHYNMNDMPGVSFLVAMHLVQMMRAKRFTMFDFGSPRTNLDAYGLPEPLDIGAHYGVINIPVDVVAGVKDKLIPPSMVRRHHETLKEAGCSASYAEFEYAHLDFTFSHSEELLAYIMSRLSLIELKTSPPLAFTGVRGTQDRLQPKTFKSRSWRKLNSIFMKSSKKQKGEESAGEVEALREGIAEKKLQGLEDETGYDLITGYWSTPSEGSTSHKLEETRSLPSSSSID